MMAGLMVLTVVQWIVFDQRAPFFQAFDNRTKNEWVNRMNATVVTALMVVFALLQGYSSHWGTAGGVAYFLHDIGHMLTYETDWSMYIHHVFSLTVVGLMRVAMTPLQAENVAIAVATLESTSPITNMSWLLNKAGFKSHPAFKYFAAFMVVFFGFMRCGVFPWLMLKKMDKVTAGVFFPLLVLNFYWFYKLIKMAMRFASTGEAPGENTEQSHAS